MCVEVLLKDDERWANSIDELRKAIYPAKVVIHDGYPRLDGNSCLCPVDMEQTAKAARLHRHLEPHGDPMLYVWCREPQDQVE